MVSLKLIMGSVSTCTLNSTRIMPNVQFRHEKRKEYYAVSKYSKTSLERTLWEPKNSVSF